MWQQIAIVLIGIVVSAVIGYKIWKFIAKPKTMNPCEGCSGCALTEGKDQMNTKGKKQKGQACK